MQAAFFHSVNFGIFLISQKTLRCLLEVLQGSASNEDLQIVFFPGEIRKIFIWV